MREAYSPTFMTSLPPPLLLLLADGEDDLLQPTRKSETARAAGVSAGFS